MLGDYSYYVDPEEDEVFFAPLATDSQLKAIAKRRTRKTMVYYATDSGDDKENINVNSKPVLGEYTPLKGFSSSALPNYQDNSFGAELDNEVECSIHNTTPCDAEDPTIDKLIDVSICRIPLEKLMRTDIFDRSNEVNAHMKILTPIASLKKIEDGSEESDAFSSSWQYKEHTEGSPKKPHYNTYSSPHENDQGACSQQDDFDDIQSLDANEDYFDLDSVCKHVSESWTSWTSADVNVQLESLTTNLNNLDCDESDEGGENYFQFSSTPCKRFQNVDLLKTPQDALHIDTDGGYLSALSEAAIAVETLNASNNLNKKIQIPELVITEATPDDFNKCSSTEKLPIKNNTARRPVRLVYRDEEEKGHRGGIKTEGSSSSGSYKSFDTPHSSPFAKPTSVNIPKSGKTSRVVKVRNEVHTDQKKKIPAADTRTVASASRIPTLSVTKCAVNKLPAAKSLQFSHIQSPLAKYIYQKSTPLVCNVKPKKIIVGESVLKSKIVSSASCGKTTDAKWDARELPPARYHKGIPLTQEKATESRLPRLGASQLRAIKPLSPRVIKHSSREGDISVLVSSEVKMSPSLKKH